MSSLINNLKKLILWDGRPQFRSFERRLCAQTQELQIFQMFYMSQMKPQEAFDNTAYSVQLP